MLPNRLPHHRPHSAYVERLELYRQRIWTCQLTGTGKLTYEQALTSEIKSTRACEQGAHKTAIVLAVC